MIDPRIQSYLDSPITTAKRASHTFLPEGRRTLKREPKPALTMDERTELQTRRKKEADAKHSQMLDYYASTSVPFDRIAVHCSMDVKHVAEAMKLRGRDA
jgi:hypothetical protein